MKRGIVVVVLYSLMMGCGPQGNTVRVEGTIYFDDYKQGVIEIAAFPDMLLKADDDQVAIGTVVIDGPGPYVLELPGDTRVAYIGCYNDQDLNGKATHGVDPAWAYNPDKKGRLVITDKVMKHVDIDLTGK